MAICPVCASMFDNVDGTCPNCGTEVGGGGAGRSHSDLFAEAMLRIKAGQYADAKGLLRSAIKQDERNGPYHFYLGSVMFKEKDYRGAFEVWQKADRFMPRNERVHKGLLAARQQMAAEEAKPKK